MLGIHPEFIRYLDRVTAGDKVIWEPNMQQLYCFSQRFCSNHDRVICGSYNGIFEPLYQFDTNGHWDPVDPIGIKFWCVEAQFLEHDVLHHLNADGSLDVLYLLHDAIRFRKGKEMGAEERQEAALLLRFLRREQIVIPHDEVTAILSTNRRH